MLIEELLIAPVQTLFLGRICSLILKHIISEFSSVDFGLAYSIRSESFCQVTQGTSEFKPTPSENREFFKSSYNVKHTLLVWMMSHYFYSVS